METLQPAKQNNMVAINKNYKVSKNEHTINEDKNKQIHSQNKIHKEHLKNITKIDEYKKSEQYFYDGNKAKHNFIFVDQTINIHKSNKGVTKEIDDISNNNIQRFKERKTQDRKIKNQKIQLNYNKSHYTEKNRQ